MKLRKFKSNKLWRDKILETCEQMGSKIHWRKLDDKEFEHALKLKLIEEADEVAQAITKESLQEELADVLEVVISLCLLHNFTLQDVIKVQLKKNQERGGFQDRKFVTVVEHPVGSEREQYCLADPEKYPEIKD